MIGFAWLGGKSLSSCLLLITVNSLILSQDDSPLNSALLSVFMTAVFLIIII